MSGPREPPEILLARWACPGCGLVRLTDPAVVARLRRGRHPDLACAACGYLGTWREFAPPEVLAHFPEPPAPSPSSPA